jgi:hypothetical protein
MVPRAGLRRHGEKKNSAPDQKLTSVCSAFYIFMTKPQDVQKAVGVAGLLSNFHACNSFCGVLRYLQSYLATFMLVTVSVVCYDTYRIPFEEYLTDVLVYYYYYYYYYYKNISWYFSS